MTNSKKVMIQIGYDEKLTHHAEHLLRGLGMDAVADKVTVVWNKRLRTTAGRAYSNLAKIELNPRLQLLSEEKMEQEINQTFLHELAHVVAHARNLNRRIQPHGPEWKEACADLGIPGEERCHSLNLGRTTRRKNFAYICPECEEVIYRVKRMSRSVACYQCCKNHNSGKYDHRYKLIEKRLV
ncbi:MAG: SprT-like domain-containing protein [Verrucomicrobiales bacterium]|nr:SprT-like domain-containing protein [Verrucomicrobiales bacterium]